jgi:hypothetical protein
MMTISSQPDTEDNRCRLRLLDKGGVGVGERIDSLHNCRAYGLLAQTAWNVQTCH